MVVSDGVKSSSCYLFCMEVEFQRSLFGFIFVGFQFGSIIVFDSTEVIGNFAIWQSGVSMELREAIAHSEKF